MADGLTLNPLSSYVTASTVGYAMPGSRNDTSNGKTQSPTAPASGVAVSISPEGMAMAKMSQSSGETQGQTKNETKGENNGAAGSQKTTGNQSNNQADKAQSESEQREVQKMKDTDTMVHQHEQAHMAAGGSLVRGSAHYEYKKGPDGKSYAVAGDVSIDMSKVRDDPAATIRKAEQIKRAALAPANPSSQDRSVAADAGAMEAEARVEQQKKSTSGASGEADKPKGAPVSGSSAYAKAAGGFTAPSGATHSITA